MHALAVPPAQGRVAGTSALAPPAAAAEARPLIVEVFGPAGSGKTTFAAALHRALGASGRRSELFSSARPAERGARQTALAPLSRAAKLFGALAELGASDPAGPPLLDLFPAPGPIVRLRHRRYLAHLHRAYSALRPRGTTLILDQGYLSALCSLAARCGLAQAPDPEPALARAVDMLPPADLVVWVQTPEALVNERLRRRLAGQSRLERLFEPEMAVLMGQARLAEAVRAILRARGRPLLDVQGTAAPGEDAQLRTVAEAVASLCQAAAP